MWGGGGLEHADIMGSRSMAFLFENSLRAFLPALEARVHDDLLRLVARHEVRRKYIHTHTYIHIYIFALIHKLINSLYHGPHA